MVKKLGDGTLSLFLLWFLVERGIIEKDYLQKFSSLLTNRLLLLFNIFLLYLFFITLIILKCGVWFINQSLNLFSYFLFVVLDLNKVDVDYESLRNLILFLKV